MSKRSQPGVQMPLRLSLMTYGVLGMVIGMQRNILDRFDLSRTEDIHEAH
jgi:hypothetical protein